MTVLRRARVALALALVGLLTVPPVLLVRDQHRTEHSLVELSRARLSAVDGLAAAAGDTQLAGVADTVTAVGTSVPVRAALSGPHPGTAALATALATIRTGMSSVTGAYALDAHGRLLAGDPAQPALIGHDFSFRDWYRGAVARRAVYVSEGFHAQVSGRPHGVGVAVAVRGPGGELLGVVGALYGLDRVQALVDAQGARDGLRTTVVDQRGQVLARTGGAGSPLLPAGDPRLDAALRRPSAGHAVVTGSNGRDVWAVTRVPHSGAVLVEVPLRVALAGVPARHRQVRRVVGVLALLILGVAGLAGLLESRRRTVSATLAEREAFLEGLLDAMDVGVASCDASGRIVYVNRTDAANHGADAAASADAGDGADAYGVARLDGSPLPAAEMPMLRALGGEEVVTGAPYLIVREGHPTRSFLANARVVRDTSGRVTGAVVVSQDVTELRDHEAELERRQGELSRSRTQLQEALGALRRSQAFTEALLESVDTGLVAVDTDGGLVLRNAAAQRMFGARDDGLTSPDLLARIVDATGGSVGGQSLPVLRSLRGETVESEELAVVLPDGTQRTVVVTARQIVADEVLLGAFVAAHDVTGQRDLLRRVREQGEQIAAAAQLVGLGHFGVDTDTGLTSYSDEVLALFGLAPGDARRGDSRLFLDAVLDPGEREELSARLADVLSQGGRHEQVHRIARLDTGEERWLRAVVECPAPDGRGDAPRSATGTMIDVTDLVRARQEADEAGALHRAVLAASPDFVFVTDVRTGAVEYASPGIRQVLGIEPDELTSLGAAAAAQLLYPEGVARLRDSDVAAQDLDDDGLLQIRYRCRHADGSWRWLSRRTTPFTRGADGTLTHVLGVVRDVSDVVAGEERLTHAARHDALTGLPNRALLSDRLESSLDGARRTGREVAVLYLDLDGFKRVNDTAGHAAGDAVLVAIAERLAAVVRPGDTVARLGGDEFVVVLEPEDRPSDGAPHDVDADRATALAVADRITQAVARPVVVHGVDHVVTASSGVAFAGTGSTGPDGRPAGADLVLQDADAAMYRAKSRGKDRCEVFEAGLRTNVQERGRVERSLRRALAAAEGAVPPQRKGDRQPVFDVAYQPVFASDGALVGFEALARLQDEQGVAVPPDVFVRVAEETGLVRQLGAVVLDRALAQLADWRAQAPGREHLRMSVNLSAHQAQDGRLIDHVLATLASHGLAGGDLVLELTETVLLQANAATVSGLRRLQEAGVRIAIDDFGTGYASLRYLTELPVDEVKIDRTFTAGLPSDPTSATIVSSVARLAADLGLDCVVEGVETDSQRAALPDGVLLQGFLLARPARAADLDVTELLAVGRAANSAP